MNLENFINYINNKNNTNISPYELNIPTKFYKIYLMYSIHYYKKKMILNKYYKNKYKLNNGKNIENNKEIKIIYNFL
jgi:hypothetical protein